MESDEMSTSGLPLQRASAKTIPLIGTSVVLPEPGNPHTMINLAPVLDLSIRAHKEAISENVPLAFPALVRFRVAHPFWFQEPATFLQFESSTRPILIDFW